MASKTEKYSLYNILKGYKNDFVEELGTFWLGHSLRVSIFSEIIAKNSNGTIDPALAREAGYLHDIGKKGVVNEILDSPKKLSGSQYDIIKKHPAHGLIWAEKIGVSDNDVLGGISEHHERWDGRGYPKGLKEMEISLMGQIVCVADAFDAMFFPRRYNRGKFKSFDDCVREIEKCKGIQFSPDAVSWFMRGIDQICAASMLLANAEIDASCDSALFSLELFDSKFTCDATADNFNRIFTQTA